MNAGSLITKLKIGITVALSLYFLVMIIIFKWTFFDVCTSFATSIFLAYVILIVLLPHGWQKNGNINSLGKGVK